MRFGSTSAERAHEKEDLTKWQPWFAWYPVRLNHDDGRYIWLEKIERREFFGWDYRSIRRGDNDVQ